MTQVNENSMDLLSFDINEATRKKIIARLIETYPLAWIVVHEALQNALDAIQKSDNPNGLVSILLNLDEQAVTIEDNGRGFPYDLNLLLYGGTDKDADIEQRKLGGNQGVGIKAVLFSSSKFEIDSVVKGNRWRLEVNDGFKYAELQKLTPKVVPPSATNEASRSIISYSFPDNKVTEFVRQVFKNFYSKVPDRLADGSFEKLKIAFEFYFRSYSYAGNASRLLGIHEIKPVSISLTIVCTQGGRLDSVPEDDLKSLLQNNSPIKITFQNKHWDVIEAVGRTRKLHPRPQPISLDLPDGGRFTRQGPNYIYVKTFTDKTQFETLLRNSNMRDQPDVSQYQSFFEYLLGIYLVVGSVDTLDPYLLGDNRRFICAQGIPSDHLIEEPKGIGELGYLSNIHCILNVSARLNFGKQSITNRWLLGQANKFFMDAFRATLRNVATAFAGKRRTTPPPPTVDVLARPDLGLAELSIVKEPRDENEVIALFFELLGRGYIGDVKVYNVSSRDIYDGKLIMKIPTEVTFSIPRSNNDLLTLEFKVNVRDLVQDFEAQVKDPSDINLLIAWRDDYADSLSPHPDYAVVGTKYVGLEDRVISGVDKCLQARQIGRYIPMLILEDIVNKHRVKT